MRVYEAHRTGTWCDVCRLALPSLPMAQWAMACSCVSGWAMTRSTQQKRMAVKIPTGEHQDVVMLPTAAAACMRR